MSSMRAFKVHMRSPTPAATHLRTKLRSEWTHKLAQLERVSGGVVPMTTRSAIDVDAFQHELKQRGLGTLLTFEFMPDVLKDVASATVKAATAPRTGEWSYLFGRAPDTISAPTLSPREIVAVQVLRHIASNIQATRPTMLMDKVVESGRNVSANLFTPELMAKPLSQTALSDVDGMLKRFAGTAS